MPSPHLGRISARLPEILERHRAPPGPTQAALLLHSTFWNWQLVLIAT
jgi:hypothetical protein